MRLISFHPAAWQQFVNWRRLDHRTADRIERLIEAARRDPEHGDGKPERLRGPLSSCWSRRIDQKNRLIYRVTGDAIEIIQIGGHYGD